MFNLPNSKTEIAQEGVRLATSMLAAGAIITAVEEYTDHTDDEIVVNVGSSVLGYYVALKLKPVTDKMVEKTASGLSRLKFKKNTTVTES